jgi:hypothetical protein
MTNILETFIIVFTIILSTIIILWHIHNLNDHSMGIGSNTATLLNINYKENNKQSSGTKGGASGSCSSTCDSIDPVSDPRYNMQQIIKQSILLEEHLTNKNKRCRDCITKHFLHIIGLAEEAQMLATNKIDKYPLINESVILYNELFKVWIKNKNLNGKDETYILYCTDKLRDHRKQLIVIYFFNEKYNIVENDKHDDKNSDKHKHTPSNHTMY